MSDTLDNGDLGYTVTQAVKPILVEIAAIFVEVMDDFDHAHILAYKRLSTKLSALIDV